MRSLFVTGTDTDVGKTWISSLIVRQAIAAGRRVGAYKPVCSGSERDDAGSHYWNDIEQLRIALGDEVPRERICPQCFHAPLAPPVAAAMEDQTVDAGLLTNGADWWKSQCDLLVIEGVGGLLCPLTESTSVADLAAEFAAPVIVVVRDTLGTINHSLLTIEVAQKRGLKVAGVVMNQVFGTHAAAGMLASNIQQIQDFGGVPVLGYCRYRSGRIESVEGAEVTPDWFSLADCAE